ncbi:RNA-directed DNA polymerase, eukaryota, reverse transcriptase zinc-binding domain protein [Tanacetum coccineum]|uniref:RNA-directed DNA polymerase, eukaryota, reverse transcriptase zinc-binding domain protein n=1 Tax=Tanacetum coccineum TaxID=301880 RepID=A0ABQ5CQH1_9ASTR
MEGGRGSKVEGVVRRRCGGGDWTMGGRSDREQGRGRLVRKSGSLVVEGGGAGAQRGESQDEDVVEVGKPGDGAGTLGCGGAQWAGEGGRAGGVCPTRIVWGARVHGRGRAQAMARLGCRQVSRGDRQRSANPPAWCDRVWSGDRGRELRALARRGRTYSGEGCSPVVEVVDDGSGVDARETGDIISSETLFRRKLSPDVADKMISSISDAEIKRSMFDIDDSKAPGPDENGELDHAMCNYCSFFTLNINGDRVGYFKGGRGLRQGYPISTYLFTLIMEVFSLIMLREIDKEPWFQYHFGCKSLKVSHVCFANDLLVMCHGDTTFVGVIKRALNEFSVCSGLHPKHSKSIVFFGSMKDDECSAISAILPFVTSKLPVRYLGVPLILVEVLRVIAVKKMMRRSNTKRVLELKHQFCNANGIAHNFSAPRTPQSNGVVERKNRTLQEMIGKPTLDVSDKIVLEWQVAHLENQRKVLAKQGGRIWRPKVARSGGDEQKNVDTSTKKLKPYRCIGRERQTSKWARVGRRGARTRDDGGSAKGRGAGHCGGAHRVTRSATTAKDGVSVGYWDKIATQSSDGRGQRHENAGRASTPRK